MGTGRLEAFSDGVIAIIITIMVLEMKVPHGDGLDDLLPAAAGVPQLRPEFRLCRHLLEQPPSHVACLHHGHGRDAVGQPAPVVLAVVVSLCHRLDGGEPFHRGAHRALRRGAADGRNRVLPAATGDHPRARAGLDPEKSGRARLEGQAVAGAVSRGDRRDPAFRRGSPRRCSWPLR